MAYQTLQKLLEQDCPKQNLLSESDFKGEIFQPKLHNGRWLVMAANNGEVWHHSEYFDSEEEAVMYAQFLSESWGISIREW